MTRLTRRAVFGLAAAALGAVTLAVAAPLPQLATDVIKDRDSFIPYRLYKPLAGKTIGVVVGQATDWMSREGRSSAFSTLGFSSGGGSYRWIYAPVTEKPLITDLQVPIGPKGEEKRVYPRLTLANTELVKQWGIEGPYCLVEMEVNDRLGSPAAEGFVATKMTRLDGTRDYPLKLTEVVAAVQKKHQQILQEQQRGIDAALAALRKEKLKDGKPTMSQFKEELFYITWLPDTERLRLHFRTVIADGAFEPAPGQNQQQQPRQPLPLPPGKGLRFDGALAAGPFQQQVRRPPPPPPPPFRQPLPSGKGAVCGVELGFAFEVTKHGKIDRVLELPLKTYHKAFEGVGPNFSRSQFLPRE